MLYWLWILSPMIAIEPIKLEELGTFQSLSLQLYKCDDRYLALVSEEPKLTLFDKKGVITATYNKAGQGAEGLFKPIFLGTGPNRIYILSSQRRLLIFDLELQLLETRDAGLPPYMTQGLLFGQAFGKNQFLLYNYLQSYYLVHQTKLTAKMDVVKSHYQRATRLEENGTYQWIHNNRHFVANMIPASSEYYTINVRKTLNPRNPKEAPVLTELVASLENFPRSNFPERAILSEMVTTDDGFIVEFASFPPKGPKSSDDFASLEFFWDYFDKKGTNLKRDLAGEKRLKPVRNSSEVFVVTSGPDDIEFLSTLPNP